jgi:hypothetical protein
MLSSFYCAKTQTDAAWAASRLYEEILHAPSLTYTPARVEALVQANTPVLSSQARLGFETSEAKSHLSHPGVPGACLSLHPASCGILQTLQIQLGRNPFLTDLK